MEAHKIALSAGQDIKKEKRMLYSEVLTKEFVLSDEPLTRYPALILYSDLDIGLVLSPRVVVRLRIRNFTGPTRCYAFQYGSSNGVLGSGSVPFREIVSPIRVRLSFFREGASKADGIGWGNYSLADEQLTATVPGLARRPYCLKATPILLTAVGQDYAEENNLRVDTACTAVQVRLTNYKLLRLDMDGTYRWCIDPSDSFTNSPLAGAHVKDCTQQTRIRRVELKEAVVLFSPFEPTTHAF